MRCFYIAIMVTAIYIFGSLALAGDACVHHVVLFDMKDGTTPEQIEELITVGEALISQIPGVQDVSINRKAKDDRNIHVKDYDIAAYIRWENIDTAKVYGPHPLHQTFLKLYKSQWAGVKVIDFYGK